VGQQCVEDLSQLLSITQSSIVMDGGCEVEAHTPTEHFVNGACLSATRHSYQHKHFGSKQKELGLSNEV